jgi:hypothetical protein
MQTKLFGLILSVFCVTYFLKLCPCLIKCPVLVTAMRRRIVKIKEQSHIRMKNFGVVKVEN